MIKKFTSLFFGILFVCSCNQKNDNQKTLDISQTLTIKERDSLYLLSTSNQILFKEYTKKVSKNQYERTCLNWYGKISEITTDENEKQIIINGKFILKEYLDYPFRYIVDKDKIETDKLYNELKKIVIEDYVYMSGIIDVPTESDYEFDSVTSPAEDKFMFYPFEISKQKIVYSKYLIKTFEFQNKIWSSMKNDPNTMDNLKKKVKEAEDLVSKLNEVEKSKMKNYTDILNVRYQLGNK